ncbi:hypothetical protein LAV76_01715 [Bacillus paramobilis]|uniref:hypothetical protein n=1 Tax=Bacillus paramobilis TaxID=2817477 RepID=UPI0030C98ADB
MLEIEKGDYAEVVSGYAFKIGEIVRYVSEEVDHDADIDLEETIYTFRNRNNVEEQLIREEFKLIDMRIVKPRRIKY